MNNMYRYMICIESYNFKKDYFSSKEYCLSYFKTIPIDTLFLISLYDITTNVSSRY